MPHKNYWAISLSFALAACSSPHALNEERSVCNSSEKTYKYRNDNGYEISVTDSQNELIVRVPGENLSADSDDLGFFIERDAEGVLVRNYSAINDRLLSKGEWSNHLLSCTSNFRTKDFEVICKNSFEETLSIIYEPNKGITQGSLGLINEHNRFKLVGEMGLFESCIFDSPR